ncbi:aspartate/glutamate racemase family protein [Entomobacter blattae]|uniref:Racemase YgeA n=1 Tax=Entomobacter blattae TaxID=2762277 RepID=A0A7H1NS85_9PROT|nr:amino acid racemase [Entomobacter blattae]QNT78645.1 Putative racemase YgeA [Entomobacter blattae]
MKKLGLIGGIGPESTILYYQKLVYGLQSKIGHKFFPNIIIESLNVFEVLDLCENKEYEKLIQYLMEGINNLIAGGAEVIALTGVTPHIVFEQLQLATAVPLISIVESTSIEAERRNYSKIGLLGTKFTVKSEFFKTSFLNKNIQVLVPNENEQCFVGEKISNELEQGVVLEKTQEEFLHIIQRMHEEEEIQAIVLGCTELPLLFRNIRLPIPVLDALDLHIQLLIDIVSE